MGNKLVGRNGIKGKNCIRNKGKGSVEDHLPNRMAMSDLTKGDPTQRSLNYYGKRTPGLGQQSPTIQDMGDSGVSNMRYSDKF
jgi:hypothetical protein